MIHPHPHYYPVYNRPPQYPPHAGPIGPGAVDTITALSTLAMTTAHAAITAVQVIVNRAVWGEYPPAYPCHFPYDYWHGCGYNNVRFYGPYHCC
ncbi:MAG: hypothetical protein JW768_00215 [Chitinispirillaceae bacterium]|nr:hypothetical protein [Chitinispirillaceae bacterium]